jgi:3-methyladenine DNA glycosylase AlkD
MQTLIREALGRIQHEFYLAADSSIAPDMQRYMKDISPFLGIKTPERREILKPIIRDLKGIDAGQLRQLIDGLYELPEREFRYAACDILAKFEKLIPVDWIDTHFKRWLITDPWWDTVDSLGNGVISPLTVRHSELEPVMRAWLTSDNMWLQRAAIGHQRGRRKQTDVPLLLEYLETVADDRRFFIAKAVGWALRDLSAINLRATKRFVAEHPNLPAVARREAVRGIERASQ